MNPSLGAFRHGGHHLPLPDLDGVVFVTSVVWSAPTRVLGGRWAIRHVCRRCRADVTTAELVAHAASHDHLLPDQ